MLSLVKSAAIAELSKLEGRCRHGYYDTAGLPTTGVGTMLPLDNMKVLPWRQGKGGAWVSEDRVLQEFARLKALGLQDQGGQAYAPHATLFLDDSVVDELLGGETVALDAWATARLPWGALYGDAQVSVLSALYNVGPNMLNPASGKFWPKFTAALRALDYVSAADNSAITGTGAGGVKTTRTLRNADNWVMLMQAARAKLRGEPLATLYGPNVTLSVKALTTANPASFSSSVWWLQAILRRQNLYTSKLDGLRGPLTTKALPEVTKSHLTELCQHADLILQAGRAVTVTD